MENRSLMDSKCFSALIGAGDESSQSGYKSFVSLDSLDIALYPPDRADFIRFWIHNHILI